MEKDNVKQRYNAESANITIIELLNKRMELEPAKSLVDRYRIMRDSIWKIADSLSAKDASDISDAIFEIETIITLFERIEKKEKITPLFVQ